MDSSHRSNGELSERLLFYLRIREVLKLQFWNHENVDQSRDSILLMCNFNTA